MANEMVTREDPRATIDEGRLVYEQMVARLMFLARQRWPEEYGTRPELTLIQGGRAS